MMMAVHSIDSGHTRPKKERAPRGSLAKISQSQLMRVSAGTRTSPAGVPLRPQMPSRLGLDELAGDTPPGPRSCAHLCVPKT